MYSGKKIWNKRSILLFSGGLITFVVLVFCMLHLMNQRLEKLNTIILKEINAESALLVQKEFDVFDQSIFLLKTLAETKEFPSIDRLIREDNKKKFIVGYQIWKGKEKASRSILHQKLFIPLASDRLQLQAVIPQEDETATFIKSQEGMYIVRQLMLDDGILQIYIDVKKLNEYFWTSSLGNRSYFEIYNADGICLLNPELEKVGVRDYTKVRLDYDKGSVVINSDYIKLPVLIQKYKIHGILGECDLLLSTLFLLTDEQVDGIVNLSILLGLILVFAIAIFLTIFYLQRRKNHRLEVNNLQYQKEQALLKFEQLQEKMDPHFLFNSLGTLQQLIGKDGQLAKSFVTKLARVYRKLLSADDSGLSLISTELELAEEYFFLQKIRFGEGLSPLDVQLDSSIRNRKVPRLSLQILLENAIKHNEISSENPLSIWIYQQDQRIVVSNELRLRLSGDESNGYGTQFLANIYDYYQISGFEIVEDKSSFKVFLPII
ncbi:sensor histidine kinase [Sphingobacterium spiritivorum]|uniref:sensor histidine kinase n=1 Tax=Sphingobacterium spiritivorum TaxID=258 RepID=UPI00191888D6|nr:histidine kinase [Sphingobacterium spiritivorum]QQT25519.1 histidine kinase [Sphingobacterium spiritivorum]